MGNKQTRSRRQSRVASEGRPAPDSRLEQDKKASGRPHRTQVKSPRGQGKSRKIHGSSVLPAPDADTISSTPKLLPTGRARIPSREVKKLVEESKSSTPRRKGDSCETPVDTLSGRPSPRRKVDHSDARPNDQCVRHGQQQPQPPCFTSAGGKSLDTLTDKGSAPSMSFVAPNTTDEYISFSQSDSEGQSLVGCAKTNCAIASAQRSESNTETTRSPQKSEGLADGGDGGDEISDKWGFGDDCDDLELPIAVTSEDQRAFTAGEEPSLVCKSAKQYEGTTAKDAPDETEFVVMPVDDGGEASEKWDFGDDSSGEDESTFTNARSKERATSRGKEFNVNGSGRAKPAQGIREHSPEEQQVRVVIDKLGRRDNAAVRRSASSSSSSSTDDFAGWNDDSEEEEEDPDEDGDDGNVYDWTIMDTGEGVSPGAQSEGDARKPSDGSVSAKKPGTVIRAKAESNPVASKLGLGTSAPCDSMAAVVPGAVSGLPPRQVEHEHARGRGPGRGRGGRVIVPGRGGRPLYKPLIPGQIPFARPQAPPYAGNSRCQGSASPIGSNNHMRVGGDMGGGGTVLQRQPTTPPPRLGSTRLVSAAIDENVTATAGTQGTGNVKVAANHAACLPPTSVTSPNCPGTVVHSRVHTPSSSMKEQGSFSADDLSSGRIITAATVSGGSAHPGSRPSTSMHGKQGSAAMGPGAPRPVSASPNAPAQDLPGRVGTGTTGTAGIAGTTAARSPHGQHVPPGQQEQQLTVKDTASITRKKAQLPQREQLEHPTPVGGSWLKNRYIVNNFILLEPLGTGSYAEVRLAKEKTSNKLYAVKIMNKDFLKKRQVGKEETFMDSIKREIAIMKKINHPNVLRLYEVMDDPKVNKLYLVLEYCKKGDLMNILNGDTRTVTCDPMNDADVWYIMRQIVQGLSFLHLQNIVHGDIKPQNLLVGSDNIAKIADFGISKFVQGSAQRLQEQAGTPTFMSPELCCGEGYSGQLADVWALGATMYMIRCGKPPFMANQVMMLYEKIQNDPLEFPPEVNMSGGLRGLMKAMMEKVPAKRITLDQVVANRWLQQGDHGYRIAPAAPFPGRLSPSSTPAAASATNSPPSRKAAGTGGAVCGSSNGIAAVSLGMRPPPLLSILPLHQQGYHAIKVSDDEVHRSINQGTTTGGYTVPAGSGVTHAEKGQSFEAPPIQRSAKDAPLSIPEEPARDFAGCSSSPPALRKSRGEGDGCRGHLSETEESWKYRSFKKKMEGGGSDPRFRGVSVTGSGPVDPTHTASGSRAAVSVHHTKSQRAPGSEMTVVVATSPKAMVPRGSRHDTESDRDRDESDDYSSEDPDTLFEGSTPSASPHATALRSPDGAGCTERVEPGLGNASRKEGGEICGGGYTVADDTATVDQGGTKVSRDPSAFSKRRSSEKFDAVMDTLAAQPQNKYNRGGGNGGTGSGCASFQHDGRAAGSRSWRHHPCPPLKGVSLRGVDVMSSAEFGSNKPGLVAADSQRQGKRPTQEDRTLMAPNLAAILTGKVEKTCLYQRYGLFAVFDGHNGQLSSETLRSELHIAIAREPFLHQVIEKALTRAFETTDRDLCARQEQIGDASGSTALAMLFDGRSRSLFVANVGDSRCVASKAGTATRLSNDHRLSRPDERQRVIASGGFVANNRINSVLAVSRSFGDVHHKEKKSPGLIATPEIMSENVASSGLEFVILATDGLWDVVDDQEAVNFVRLALLDNCDLSDAAMKLTKLALDEGSVDNVSVVIVWFQERTAIDGAGRGGAGGPEESQQ